MATIKQGMRLSAIMDKIDVKIDNPDGTAEQIGSDLILQVVKKAYKAEKEIISFVAETKGITEEEAQEIDIVEFVNELAKDMGFASFFESAVK